MIQIEWHGRWIIEIETDSEGLQWITVIGPPAAGETRHTVRALGVIAADKTIHLQPRSAFESEVENIIRLSGKINPVKWEWHL